VRKVVFVLASMLVVMLSGCGNQLDSSATNDADISANSNHENSAENTEEIQGLSQFPVVPALPES